MSVFRAATQGDHGEKCSLSRSAGLCKEAAGSRREVFLTA